MGQLQISDRVAAGFVSVLGLVAVMIVIVIMQTSAARQRAAQINELRAPAALASQRLYAATIESANNLRGFVITRDPQLRDDWAAQWLEIERQSAALDALAGRFTDPENRRAWARARQLLPRLKAAQAQVIETAAATASAEVPAQRLRAEVLPLFTEIRQLLDSQTGGHGVTGAQASLLTAELSSAAMAIERANTSLLVGGALMLLAGAGLVGLTLSERRGTSRRLLDPDRGPPGRGPANS